MSSHARWTLRRQNLDVVPPRGWRHIRVVRLTKPKIPKSRRRFKDRVRHGGRADDDRTIKPRTGAATDPGARLLDRPGRGPLSASAASRLRAEMAAFRPENSLFGPKMLPNPPEEGLRSFVFLPPNERFQGRRADFPSGLRPCGPETQAAASTGRGAARGQNPDRRARTRGHRGASRPRRVGPRVSALTRSAS